MLCQADAPTQTVVSNRVFMPLPDDGQVLVHVSKLVVTANTVTYALAGKMPPLKYFDHFPLPEDAPDSVAMCPCWGTGIVISSKCGAVKTGTRIHGYFPFAPTVVLTPSDVKDTEFMDAAKHRSHLLPPYKTYYTHEAPQYKGLSYAEEDYHMATGVLFTTGWAMAQVAAVHPKKPTALLLTSASSRTSRAAAFAAQFHELPMEIIGLTSAANYEYTRSLGIYDIVVEYGQVETLTKQPVAIQDVAGSSTVREDIYRHFGSDIVYCGSVG